MVKCRLVEALNLEKSRSLADIRRTLLSKAEPFPWLTCGSQQQSRCRVMGEGEEMEACGRVSLFLLLVFVGCLRSETLILSLSRNVAVSCDPLLLERFAI